MGRAKKFIAVVLVTSLVVGAVTGGLLYMRTQNVKTVKVCSVQNLLSTYYSSDEATLDAQIATSTTQSISFPKDTYVDEVFVAKGDLVTVGQPLVSLDTSLIEMRLRKAQLERIQMEISLRTALGRLAYIEHGGDISADDMAGYSYSGGGLEGYIDDAGSSSSSSGSWDELDSLSMSELSSVGGSSGRLFAFAQKPFLLLASLTTDLFASGEEEPRLNQEEAFISGSQDSITYGDAGQNQMQGAFTAEDAIPILSEVSSVEDADGNEGEVYSSLAGQDDGSDFYTWDGGSVFVSGGGSGNEASASVSQTEDGAVSLFTSGETYVEPTIAPDYPEEEDDDDSFFDPDHGMNNYLEDMEGIEDFSSEMMDEFSDGDYFPWLSPTPVPADPYAWEEGKAPFYQILDWDTLPYRGSGTKVNPFVYLCSSSVGGVTVTGGLLNIMAGYNREGTKVLKPGGYWYRLEFHKDDAITDAADLSKDRIGYYLIKGNLLIDTIDPTWTTYFSLEEATGYEPTDIDTEITDQIDTGQTGFDTGLDTDGSSFPTLDDGTSTGGNDDWSMTDDGYVNDAPTSRLEVLYNLRKEIDSMRISIQEKELSISQYEKQAANKVYYSKIDGIVSKVSDNPESSPFMTIKSTQGFFVQGKVNELLLDEMEEGARLECTDYYTNTKFEAEVLSVADYPENSDNGMFGFGSGTNPNVSNYSFTATIVDKDVHVNDQDYLSVALKRDASSTKGIVLEKAFVRSEQGQYYVMKSENGYLKKQYVLVKDIVNSGTSVLIGGGVKKSDLIAFPYSSDAEIGRAHV